MTHERVAQLIRRAAADTGVVSALKSDPRRLQGLLRLTEADLEALAATTTLPEQRPAARMVVSMPAGTTGDGGTLLPPEGSGEPAGTLLSGITGTATPDPPPVTPAPPPSQPPAPPMQPPSPGRPPVPPPATTQPPAPTTPPAIPPMTPPIPPTIGPPVALPAPPPPWPPPWPTPAVVAFTGGAPCGCQSLAVAALLSTLSTTAITAITAIASMPRNRCANGAEGGDNAKVTP